MNSLTRNELRKGLPPLPQRMRHLHIDDRGFPTPYFVAWIDGKPDFRVIAPGKVAHCWTHQKCWICSEPLGRFTSFVIGPMCVFNRTSAEPGSHLDCARFAAMACPFLVKPAMRRNEKDLPDEVKDPAGHMIRRNPGACAIWTTREPHVFRANGGVLFNIGAPNTVEWYAEGDRATRAQVLESISTGLPLLIDMANRDPDPVGARKELLLRAKQAGEVIPPGEGAINLLTLAPEGVA